MVLSGKRSEAPMRTLLVAGRRLGRLEADVMELFWSREEPLRVDDVLCALRGPRRAYTTVMTILTRLVAKGLVRRERLGRSFVYRPAGTREELAAQSLRDILTGTDDPQAVLARFVAALEATQSWRSGGAGSGARSGRAS